MTPRFLKYGSANEEFQRLPLEVGTFAVNNTCAAFPTFTFEKNKSGRDSLTMRELLEVSWPTNWCLWAILHCHNFPHVVRSLRRVINKGFWADLRNDPERAAEPARNNEWCKLVSMSIKTLSSREVYRNPWLRVREDQVERSNGVHGIYGVVDKDDCAIILPIQGDTIYLIEQFRYTVQQRCLELPQGGWETPGVDPEELARGELREETGLIAASMTHLGAIWIAYGFVHQKQHVYLATGLAPAGADPDPEEHDLVLRAAPIAQFEEMILNGTIRDGCTLAAWGLYKLWKERNPL